MAARSSSAQLELIRFFERSIVVLLSAAARDGRAFSQLATGELPIVKILAV
jgi:hypothetical protein